MHDDDASVCVHEGRTISGMKDSIIYLYIRSDERKFWNFSSVKSRLHYAVGNIVNDSPFAIERETSVITVLYHPLLGYGTLYYSSCNKTVNLKMWAALASRKSHFVIFMKICSMMDSVGVLKCAVGTYFLRWLFSNISYVTTRYLQCKYINVGSKYFAPCHQI